MDMEDLSRELKNIEVDDDNKEHLCNCWKCKGIRKKRRESMSDLTIPQVFKIIKDKSKYCSICGKPLGLDNKIDWHLPFCIECRLKVVDKEAKKISADFEVAQNAEKGKKLFIKNNLPSVVNEEKTETKEENNSKDDGW